MNDCCRQTMHRRAVLMLAALTLTAPTGVIRVALFYAVPLGGIRAGPILCWETVLPVALFCCGSVCSCVMLCSPLKFLSCHG